MCPFPLYPSYLVEDNLPIPFGSVHIENSIPLEMSPTYGPLTEQGQLCRDHVRVHLYGCDNEMALTFLSFVLQYSYDWMKIGMANSPVVKDMKEPQSEFKIIAQRKQIDFDVNYLQSVARDEARQFVKNVKVQNQWNWIVGDP
jgi:hypothetical protein